MRWQLQSGLIVALGLAGAAGTCGCFLEERDLPPDPRTAYGDTLADPACIPATDADATADDCGSFVSPAGSDDNPGTKEAPFRTIARGMNEGTNVYVCADPEKPYIEAVTAKGGKWNLFGGLDCETWKYAADTRTTLSADAGEVPLTLSEMATVRVKSFAITAQDAPELQEDVYRTGRSSIAIWTQPMTTLDLERCVVIAGTGSPGAPGEPPGPKDEPASSGTNGSNGCNDKETAAGGPGGENVCSTVNVSGGDGGSGKISMNAGGDGTEGKPSLPMSETGKAGAGQQLSASTLSKCGNGGTGADGTDGLPGMGASGDSLGQLKPFDFIGARGNDGTSGGPGQGGGGGGGALMCAANGAGPGGGGGGAGGCGGAGGKGGYGGGASIAIVSIHATLTLSTTSISTSSAGEGGEGAIGQEGSDGGKGGNPGKGDDSACWGGDGGTGGDGGRGGGGRGGHSIGIAHVGPAPVLSDTVQFKLGTPGLGGFGDMSDGHGAPGLQTELMELPLAE